jgi:hypothetical protein
MNLRIYLFSHNNGRRGRWPCQPDEAWYPKAEGLANAGIPLGKRNRRPISGVFGVSAPMVFLIYKD